MMVVLQDLEGPPINGYLLGTYWRFWSLLQKEDEPALMQWAGSRIIDTTVMEIFASHGGCLGFVLSYFRLLKLH
jgi:hypothetical protein